MHARTQQLLLLQCRFELWVGFRPTLHQQIIQKNKEHNKVKKETKRDRERERERERRGSHRHEETAGVVHLREGHSSEGQYIDAAPVLDRGAIPGLHHHLTPPSYHTSVTNCIPRVKPIETGQTSGCTRRQAHIREGPVKNLIKI